MNKNEFTKSFSENEQRYTEEIICGCGYLGNDLSLFVRRNTKS